MSAEKAVKATKKQKPAPTEAKKKPLRIRVPDAVERWQKTDRVVRATRQQHPLTIATGVMHKVLQGTAVDKDALAQNSRIMAKAEAASKAVEEEEGGIQTAVNEKLAKADARRKRKLRKSAKQAQPPKPQPEKRPQRKDKAVLREALGTMKSELKSDKVLVHQAMRAQSNSAHQNREDVYEELKEAHSDRHKIMEKVQRRSAALIHDSEVAQNQLRAVEDPLHTSVQKLVASANKQHQAKVAMKKSEQFKKRQEVAAARATEAKILPNALSHMKHILSPVRESEQHALSKKKQQSIDIMVTAATKQSVAQRQAAKAQKASKKASQIKRKHAIIQNALSALLKEDNAVHQLRQTGLSRFAPDSVGVSEKILMASRKQRASEKRQKSSGYIKHKAHEAELEVQNSVQSVRRQAAEKVGKAPGLERRHKHLVAEGRIRRAREKSEKVAGAIHRAQEQSREAAKVAMQSERAYESDMRPVNAAVQHAVDNAPALQAAKHVQQARQFHRQQEQQQLQKDVHRAENLVNVANSKATKLEPHLPAWSKAKGEREANAFLDSKKYDNSNQGKYDSLMDVLSKPAS